GMGPRITIERLHVRVAESIISAGAVRSLVFVLFPGLLPMTTPFVAVIDDDTALCSSLVDLLRSFGCRAEAFASAEAFLTSDSGIGANCIIADVNMPGMGGLDLLRELRERNLMTPVVLITALPDKHLDEEAASTGALCLLRKPLETSALFACIERGILK